jgi:oxalate decarboxylase/phosphoglucose isomerase-like protein (cupin superfamily)
MGRTVTVYEVTVNNVGSCPLIGATLSVYLPSGSAVTHLENLEFAVGGSMGASVTFNLIGLGGSVESGGNFCDARFTLATSSNQPAMLTISAQGKCASSCPTEAPSTPQTGFAGQKELDEEFVTRLKTAATQVRRFDLLNDTDFVFDFTTATVQVSRGEAGKLVSANAADFPAVIGNNIAMTVGYVGPCGINLPHTHPRATEINFVVSGTFEAGLVMENGVRFVGNNLTAGMATVFPQGAIHFEQNLNCEPAVFVAAFNSEDPGVSTIGSTFFGLPVDVSAASLNIPIKTVEDLIPFLPKNPALGIEECRRRCGL